MYQSCSICYEGAIQGSICDKCIAVKNNLAKIHRVSTQEFQEKISQSRAAARVAQYATDRSYGRRSHLEGSWWDNSQELKE